MAENCHESIKIFLSRHFDKLSKKRETQKGTLPWYCLHWPRSKEDFERPKILIRQTASTIIAVLDTESHFPIDSIHTINLRTIKRSEIQELKYLLGLLNSKLLKYLYNWKLAEEGKVFPQIKKTNIEWIPIKQTTEDIELKVASIVDNIMDNKKSASLFDTSALEKEIDQLVYELYGLSEEEIKIVEGV